MGWRSALPYEHEEQSRIDIRCINNLCRFSVLAELRNAKHDPLALHLYLESSKALAQILKGTLFAALLCTDVPVLPRLPRLFDPVLAL